MIFRPAGVVDMSPVRSVVRFSSLLFVLGSWADRSQAIKQTLAQHPSKDPVVDHAPPKKVPQSATKTEVKADKAG
jgi:hypothetical protein